MEHEVSHYYGLISLSQIHMTNVNMGKILSTVYPIISALFYKVKNYCKQNRHVHAVLKHD